MKRQPVAYGSMPEAESRLRKLSGMARLLDLSGDGRSLLHAADSGGLLCQDVTLPGPMRRADRRQDLASQLRSPVLRDMRSSAVWVRGAWELSGGPSIWGLGAKWP